MCCIRLVRLYSCYSQCTWLVQMCGLYVIIFIVSATAKGFHLKPPRSATGLEASDDFSITQLQCAFISLDRPTLASMNSSLSWHYKITHPLICAIHTCNPFVSCIHLPCVYQRLDDHRAWGLRSVPKKKLRATYAPSQSAHAQTRQRHVQTFPPLLQTAHAQ